MATRIFYAQARPIEGEDLYLAEPDLFRVHIHRCFGDFPVELDKKDIDKLTGMAATWREIAPNPYDALIRAIKRLGSVKVWASYPTADAELTPAQHAFLESIEKKLEPPQQELTPEQVKFVRSHS